MFRVEFTLTKIQKRSRKTELRQITQSHKLYEKNIYIKTKLFILQTHLGQANGKPKAKQKTFQIKNFRLLAYGTFQKFRKTSTFSLKDERVLLLSLTLQAAKAGSQKTKVMSHSNNNPQPTPH